MVLATTTRQGCEISALSRVTSLKKVLMRYLIIWFTHYRLLLLHLDLRHVLISDGTGTVVAPK